MIYKDRAVAYILAAGLALATLVESVQEKDLSSALLCIGVLAGVSYLLVNEQRRGT